MEGEKNEHLWKARLDHAETILYHKKGKQAIEIEILACCFGWGFTLNWFTGSDITLVMYTNNRHHTSMRVGGIISKWAMYVWAQATVWEPRHNSIMSAKQIQTDHMLFIISRLHEGSWSSLSALATPSNLSLYCHIHVYNRNNLHDKLNTNIACDGGWANKGYRQLGGASASNRRSCCSEGATLTLL